MLQEVLRYDHYQYGKSQRNLETKFLFTLLIGSDATSCNIIEEKVYDSKMREEDDDNFNGKRLTTNTFSYKLYNINFEHCLFPHQ